MSLLHWYDESCVKWNQSELFSHFGKEKLTFGFSAHARIAPQGHQIA